MEGGNARDGRNCSRDGVLRNETNDRKHGKASVVQFTVLLDLHGLRLDTREVDRREDNRGKSSTVEVVGLLDLRGDFGNKESANNLPLACEYDMEKCVRRKCEAETVGTWSRLVNSQLLTGIGDRSPLVNGVQAGKGFEGDVGAQHAREVDTSSLNKVSSDGKHCNTAVLELGSPEPVEGLIGADLRVSKRVKLLKGGSAARHTFESGADGGGGLRREKKMQ